MVGDLHCHSIYSDSSASLEQLISYALRLKLDYLALTDHDTMKGISKLQRLAKGLPLYIIPGVECTTKDPFSGRPVHILCYNPQKPEILQPVLKKTSRCRMTAKLEMVDKIMKIYPILCKEDVLYLSQKSASIFESHIMVALAVAGVTNQPFGPLLEELIGKNGTCYVPVLYPNTLDVIERMHQAQGLVVVAHPGQFDSIDLIHYLAKEHLIHGIECMHYKNSREVTRTCVEIAQKYDLLITGGSDFHGMFTTSPHPLGFHTTDESNSKRLFELLRL